MAKNVKINGVSYTAVPNVKIPLSDGSGNAVFYETSGATIQAQHVLAGFKGFGASGEVNGSLTVPSVSQDGSTKVLTIS